MAVADDGGDDGACGEGDLGERAAYGAELWRDGGFDDVNTRFPQAQQGHRVRGAGGFLDEGDQGGGCGNCGVDSPVLVEEQGVFRVVDACRDAGDMTITEAAEQTVRYYRTVHLGVSVDDHGC
ncbi:MULTISPECIES: hypothetical protein [unclassified Streptomyces]|uniref:hypothetical protein n=1 Tax=unclassified Streptomyces TaxID=2593676 RepID=UPI002DD7C5BB|nr:hypothetical protein [Streptomyces sp. NBC_01750]WSB05736.1 hypothetical protein OIE54_33385 [Streptomyces sp. NBC_01794]WSD38064.1 hypothetical protein OG966_08675 [Streptomyces sp. NBC_01750]